MLILDTRTDLLQKDIIGDAIIKKNDVDAW